MMPIRQLCCLLLIFCLLVGSTGIVHAIAESLNVESGKEFVYKINLDSGDRVQFSFVTTGQASSKLCFSITFPNSTVANLGETDQFSTSFTSNAKGTCELHFDNTNSSEASLIALDYEVQHYILGMPEMIFVLVVIAVLLMVVVTGYIIMGKYS